MYGKEQHWQNVRQTFRSSSFQLISSGPQIFHVGKPQTSRNSLLLFFTCLCLELRCSVTLQASNSNWQRCSKMFHLLMSSVNHLWISFHFTPLQEPELINSWSTMDWNLLGQTKTEPDWFFVQKLRLYRTEKFLSIWTGNI